MEPTAETEPITIQTPTIRVFVLGLFLMNVINGVLLALFYCILPLICLLVAAIPHTSILKLHILFVVAIALGLSFGANVFQTGVWCVRGLLGPSVDKRLIIIIGLLVWQLVMFKAAVAGYFDLFLVGAALCYAGWDKWSSNQGPMFSG